MKSKHLLNSIVAIAIMFYSFTGYAENYDITVGNVRVTSENAGNVTGPKIVSGKVIYDAASKTLTLDNAQINGTIDVSTPNVVILIKGNVKAEFVSFGHPGCETGAIKGLPGSWLELKEEFNSIVLTYMDPAFTLTLENLNGVFSSKNPIEGGGGTSLVKIVNCNLTFDSSTEDRFIVSDINGFSTEGCSIVYPEGAVFNPSTKMLELNGQGIKHSIHIGTSKENFVPIQIAGSFMTSPEFNSTNAPCIQSGKVTYDKQRNTLLLDNVKIGEGYMDKMGLNSIQKDLTIELKGNVVMPGFAFSENATVKGLPESNLTLNNFKNHSLWIKNCGVLLKDIKGEIFRDIYGQTGAGTEICTLENCQLRVNTKENIRAIANMSDFVLKGCGIQTPAGAFYSQFQKQLLNSKNSGVYEPVEIVLPTNYGIKVCGIDIHQFNKTNLKGPGYTGSADYVSDTKWLILKDFVVDKSKHSVCVESKVDDIRVEFWGSAEISGLRLQQATILSDNTISMNLTEKEKGIVFTDSLFLMISDGVLKAGGVIEGSNKEKDVLVIHNGNLTLDGLGKPTISGISKLYLRACDIVSPAGAAFDPELGGVALNGELVTSEIVIKKREPRDYGVQVGDIPIMDGNIDLFKDYYDGLASFAYDEKSSTLYIDNVQEFGLLVISGATENSFYGDTLNIVIKNNVEFKHINSLRKYVKIQGSPLSTLVVDSNNDGTPVISGNDLDLVNLNGVFSGSAQGIFTQKNLLIKNCNLEINSLGTPLLAGREIAIVDCGVTFPLDVTYEKGTIWLGEDEYKGKMVISNAVSGIENVAAEADDDPNAPMFNVMGQRIERPYHGQLYIQNGKKKVWFNK